LRVPVTVVKRLRQRLTATPNRVTLTVPAQGAVPSQLLRIRDGNDEDVEVDRVTADDPAILFQWSKGANRVATVKISLDGQRVTDGGALCGPRVCEQAGGGGADDSGDGCCREGRFAFRLRQKQNHLLSLVFGCHGLMAATAAARRAGPHRAHRVRRGHRQPSSPPPARPPT